MTAPHFPNNVWNGLTPTRQDPHERRAPDVNDIDQVMLEIQAIEKFLFETLVGKKEFQGLKGEQGIEGRQGLKGDTGDKGDMGREGPQGAQGVRGIQGIQGEQGVQGHPGLKGEPGIEGPKGEQGLRGLTGMKGDRGPRGESGLTKKFSTRVENEGIIEHSLGTEDIQITGYDLNNKLISVPDYCDLHVLDSEIVEVKFIKEPFRLVIMG